MTGYAPPRPKGHVVLEGHIYWYRVNTFSSQTAAAPFGPEHSGQVPHVHYDSFYPQVPSMYVTLGGPKGMLVTKSNSTEQARPSRI